MAYNFIGESPDPLPMPPGLRLEPKRFIGGNGPMPSKGPPLDQRHVSPKQLKVRYMATRPDGRLKPETLLIEDLPDNVSERYMMWQMYEMLNISPRHPLELRFWGEPLELFGTGVDGEEHLDRPLSYYSIKEHSEVTVVVKPLLPLHQARKNPLCDYNLTRLRVASHKLGASIPVDLTTGNLADMKVRSIKDALVDYLKKNPIYLVRGPPRPGILLTKADGETAEVRAGDHFVKDTGGAAAGGKGKGPPGLRRVPDPRDPLTGMPSPLSGALQEADVWEMKLGEEELPSIQFNGFPLSDDSLITSHQFVNNEIIYLNFKLPWEENDPKPVPGAKGGKK